MNKKRYHLYYSTEGSYQIHDTQNNLLSFSYSPNELKELTEESIMWHIKYTRVPEPLAQENSIQELHGKNPEVFL